MDEKNLFHPINEAAQHDYLSKAAPSTESLETPLQALPGKTLLKRLIERLQERAQGFGDRSPDDRADDWMERVNENARTFLDRFADRDLDRRLEGASQFFAAIGAEGDRFREDAGDLMRALLLVVEPVVEFAQLLLLGPDEQLAQLIQVVERFSRR